MYNEGITKSTVPLFRRLFTSTARWAPILMLGATLTMATLGCNTVRGAGKDVQLGGQAIEKAAENVEAGKEVKPAPYTITSSASAHGSITPAGTLKYAYGTPQTYTIRADRGYHIADVRIDGRSIGPVGQYLFKGTTGNHSIIAAFERNR